MENREIDSGGNPFRQRSGWGGLWANNPPYSKFLIVIGLVVTGMAASTLLSAFLASVIFGVSFMELQTLLSDFDNPLSIPILKFIQTFSAIGTFIIPAFVIGWLFDQNAFDYLKLSKRASLISVILVFVLLFAALPLINYLGELNSRMSLPSWLSGVEHWMRSSEDDAAKLMDKFLEIHTVSGFIFSIIMIAVLPALSEELIFRGILQRLFSEWSKNIHVGIWSSAILFSAMHMQFYGFIPRMLLGVMLGYLLFWSGSLWLPIIAHFINNAAAVIFAFLFSHKMIEVDADKIGTANDYAALSVSVLMTAVLLWMIYKKEKRGMNEIKNE